MLDDLELSLRVEIRDLQPDDLSRGVGWLSHRQQVFWGRQSARADAGEIRLLVAVAGGSIVGHLGVELARKRQEGVGILWNFGVIPPLQFRGVGRRMVAVAERIIGEASLSTAEVASYKDNDAVTRWYERLGYEIVGEELDDWLEVRPDGTTIQHDEPCWTMRKTL